MKQVLVLLALIYLTSCAKQQEQPQHSTVQNMQRTIDSLNMLIRDLKGQSTNKATGSSQVKVDSVKRITAGETTPLQDHREEWKEVRNGGSRNVNWEMQVMNAHDDYSICWLAIPYDFGKDYAPAYMVQVYNSHIALHDYDKIIVIGKASGVEENGAVILHSTKVINKGVE